MQRTKICNVQLKQCLEEHYNFKCTEQKSIKSMIKVYTLRN